MVAEFNEGLTESIRAIAPDTCGVAPLVPVRPEIAGPLRPSESVLFGPNSPNRLVDHT